MPESPTESQTDPAIVADPAQQAEAPTEPQAEAPPAWNWEKDRPNEFKKYGTPEDAAKAFRSLQSEYTKFKSEAAKQGVKEEPKAGIDPAIWQGHLNTYYEHGAIDDDAIDNLNKSTGLPADTIHGFFNYMKSQREAFIGKAQERLGEELSYNDIEQWLASGDSNYDPDEIAAFNKLAGRGNLSWLDSVKDDYLRGVEAGAIQPNTPAKPTMSPASKAPPRTTRPAPTGVNGEYFNSHSEFMSALKAASEAADGPAEQRVYQKLERTPAHLRNSQAWKTS